MSDYAVVNPATGETVKTYPTISDDALKDAIGRADTAGRAWVASTTVEERAALLREARERDEAVAGLAASAQYAGDADPYVKPREFDEAEEEADAEGLARTED